MTQPTFLGTTIVTGKTWQATTELRWLREDRLVEHEADNYYMTMTVLQQKWYCLDNGKTEWRDVPTVTE